MKSQDLMSLLEVSRRLISERSLEGLLELINSTATRIAGCERGTVYLIDRDRNEIWSRVKHGEEIDEIRLPMGHGIAGTVAVSGEVVNIEDAYSDPRFDTEWDGRTGFRTRNILCLPMESREGEQIGVIQLLNKNDGPFTEYDLSVLSALSANAAVAFETAWLLEEMVEKKRMEEGLRIARDIQQGLLPSAPPEIEGLDIALLNIPCDETGGDYVDVFRVLDGRTTLVIGDVSGHGIGAALLMATGRAFLRAFTGMHGDPAALLERINSLLLEDTDPSRYMTLWYGVMDQGSGSILYAAAGHDEPVLVSGRDGSWETLENTGIPLGMLPGMSYGPAREIVLEEGDLLVLTTDGLWEQMNESGEPFGKDNLAQCLSGLRESSAETVVEGIRSAILSYRGRASQDDDYTILVVKRLQV